MLCKYIKSFGIWGLIITLCNVFTASQLALTLTGSNTVLIENPILWIVLLVLGLIFPPYWAYRRLFKTHENMINVLPKVNYIKSEYVTTPLYDTINHNIIGSPFYLHAIFENTATAITNDAHAEKVLGLITFCYEGRELLSMEGRWAGTPEVWQVGMDVMDRNQIDLQANGRQESLDLVIKYQDNECCYGHNNETQIKGWDLRKDLDKKLKKVSTMLESI